jgi:hypothetical protein
MLPENWYRELFPGFSKPVMNVKTLLVSCRSCSAYWNPPVTLWIGFQKSDSQITSGFLKPACVLSARSVSRNIDSGTAFVKVSTISKGTCKCFHRSSLNIIFLNIWGTSKQENFKTISGPAESTNLNFQNQKYNPLSGETVPLRRRQISTYILNIFICMSLVYLILLNRVQLQNIETEPERIIQQSWSQITQQKKGYLWKLNFIFVFVGTVHVIAKSKWRLTVHLHTQF